MDYGDNRNLDMDHERYKMYAENITLTEHHHRDCFL